MQTKKLFMGATNPLPHTVSNHSAMKLYSVRSETGWHQMLSHGDYKAGDVAEITFEITGGYLVDIAQPAPNSPSRYQRTLAL